MAVNVDCWKDQLSERLHLSPNSIEVKKRGKEGPSIPHVHLIVGGERCHLEIVPSVKYFPFLGNNTSKPLSVKVKLLEEPEVSREAHLQRWYFMREHLAASGLKKVDDAKITVCYTFFDSLERASTFSPEGVSEGAVVIGIVGLKHYLSSDFEVVKIEGVISPCEADLHSLRFRKFIEGM